MVQVNARSLIQLYIYYGVLCGSGVGIGYNAIIATITKWFPERTGLASGVLLMSFGLGGLILGSLILSIIGQSDLFKTFTYLAVITSAILVLGSPFIKAPPVKPDSDEFLASDNSNDYTTKQMISTPQFWLFFLWTMLIAASGLLVINSAATIAVTFGAPAILGLAVSVFNGTGRILVGAAADSIGLKRTTYLDTLAMLLAGIILIIGVAIQSALLILIGLIFVGVAYGGAPLFTSTVTNHLFGEKNFAANLSIANFMVIPAAIIGPLVSSYLQDISDGSYIFAFAMIVVLSLISLALNWLLCRKAKIR